MQGGYVEITLLGTGSATPDPGRWLPSILVKIRGEYLLLDCGEGAQYRVLRAGMRVNRLSAILITHLHGDHLYGLPGLLQSLGTWGRRAPLLIAGPSGIDEYLKHAVRGVRLDYRLSIESVEPGCVFSGNGYAVFAVPARHGDSEAYAFIIEERDLPGKFDERKAEALGVPFGPLRGRLIRGEEIVLPSGKKVKPEDVVGPPRKGIKIVYSGDTAPCSEIAEAAIGADVLLHEATFSSMHLEEALASGHSTAADAARIAACAKVKLLLLLHFSNRYGHPGSLLREARSIFARTYLGKDMLKLALWRIGESSLKTALVHLARP